MFEAARSKTGRRGWHVLVLALYALELLSLLAVRGCGADSRTLWGPWTPPMALEVFGLLTASISLCLSFGTPEADECTIYELWIVMKINPLSPS